MERTHRKTFALFAQKQMGLRRSSALPSTRVPSRGPRVWALSQQDYGKIEHDGRARKRLNPFRAFQGSMGRNRSFQTGTLATAGLSDSTPLVLNCAKQRKDDPPMPDLLPVTIKKYSNTIDRLRQRPRQARGVHRPRHSPNGAY